MVSTGVRAVARAVLFYIASVCFSRFQVKDERMGEMRLGRWSVRKHVFIPWYFGGSGKLLFSFGFSFLLRLTPSSHTLYGIEDNIIFNLIWFYYFIKLYCLSFSRSIYFYALSLERWKSFYILIRVLSGGYSRPYGQQDHRIRPVGL